MEKKYGVLLVFLTAIISGVSFFVNKFTVSKIEPYTLTFLKNLIVGIILVGIVSISKELKNIKDLKKGDWFLLVLIGLVGGSVPFLLFFKGLSLTSAASGSFTHKTMFLFASIFAVIFLKEKIPKKLYITSIVLLAGNFLILKLINLDFGFGEFLILSATILWAIENILSKYALRKLSGNVVACGRMLFGSVFIFAFLTVSGKLNGIIGISKGDILWVLVTSVILLGFVITYYNGLKYVKVTTATSILLLGSPITTLLSVLFSDMHIMISEVIGVMLIIVIIAVWVLVLESTDKRITVFQSRSHNE